MRIWLILVVVAAMVLGAAGGGWAVRDSMAVRERAEMKEQAARAAILAQQEARQREEQWEEQHEQIVVQAELRAASAEREHADALLALGRLRDAVGTADRGRARACPAFACSSHPAVGPDVVQADVPASAGAAVVELGGLAVDLADAYDRARIAGLACEQAYNTVRER